MNLKNHEATRKFFKADIKRIDKGVAGEIKSLKKSEIGKLTELSQGNKPLSNKLVCK
jgi:hypothetical protein